MPRSAISHSTTEHKTHTGLGIKHSTQEFTKKPKFKIKSNERNKVKVEINEIDDTEIVGKIMKTKSWFTGMKI